MEEFLQISQSQYFSIEWAADSLTNTPLRHDGTVPPPGKAKSVNDELTSCSIALQDVIIVYAKIERSGILRIVPRGRPVTLAARISESSNLRWDHAEPLDTGANDVSLGTIRTTVEIRLPPAEATFVLAPSDLVAQPEVRLPPTHVPAGTHPALDVLMAQASTLVGRRLTPTLAQVCEASLRGLLTVALAGGTPAKARPDAPDRLYREVLLDIAANCGRHDYGVVQVAQRHKINVRTLQKMFQKRGTTLKEHITASRLQLARDALLDPANADKKVSDIAFEAGFNDVNTFNRLFRKRFGRTPSALRAQPSGSPAEPAA
ncbi:helix-turn-helix transcriptional regulator [Xanthobacter dioxanivorans]|uniref:Helix-turn-helix transcriptional regulator n=1 Tax=Xanthobacter dioxanivorans TaxID=2528964 RepID=A0A974PT44_9HYPH|nr:helix-turn-helix domain-containing protein [Xanthobacter dioxanivorans]QRG09312.1 helix-turn-helix transcriptional regulator [Xanthobacter dioxanivorans]